MNTRLLCLLLAIVLCVSCTDPVSRDEVTRVPSPSGHIDAVLIETNGGATTSFGYDVYLVRSGGNYKQGFQVASLYGAARNESAYGVNLKWSEPQKLMVEYLKAHWAELLRDHSVVESEQVQ
ncbi:MAG TPA: hypothetical protein VID27_15460, partial [Blastocatellia bacterium]